MLRLDDMYVYVVGMVLYHTIPYQTSTIHTTNALPLFLNVRDEVWK